MTGRDHLGRERVKTRTGGRLDVPPRLEEAQVRADPRMGLVQVIDDLARRPLLWAAAEFLEVAVRPLDQVG